MSFKLSEPRDVDAVHGVFGDNGGHLSVEQPETQPRDRLEDFLVDLNEVCLVCKPKGLTWSNQNDGRTSDGGERQRRGFRAERWGFKG